MSDVPAAALAGDRVDPAGIEQPKRWEVGSIRRFRIVFGCMSSLFDFLAFGLLVFVFHADAQIFQPSWFLLSLLTELGLLLAVRTRGSLLLAFATAVTAMLAVALPFTATGRRFELAPPPDPPRAVTRAAGSTFDRHRLHSLPVRRGSSCPKNCLTLATT